MPEPVLMCWSGGKDSSLALQAVLQDPALNVEALLTTVTEGYERISMHGVRRALLEQQAASLKLPLEQVRIPIQASNAVYEAAMRDVLMRYQARGVSRVVFGDLFLEDIRRYRERNLAQLGMQGLFPLWLKDTAALARAFIAQGFRAILVCVDPNQLDPAFCGREFDEALLRDFPPGVDPCGERGEFHTFVYDGPIFQRPIPVAKGEIVEREGFWFCDLLPGSKPVMVG
ncbi:MAG: diphthine--ammonia ligase [Candidatus Omnitrophica bacterium]|nr:diphthine--ammonia ligase [Candidatus Omnitrophota bacterium]